MSTVAAPLPGSVAQAPYTAARRHALSVPVLGVVAALAGAALLAGWFVSYALFFSRLAEQHQQSLLYAKFREQLAAATAPIGGAIHYGDPVALIDAPGGGVHDEVVVEGTGSGQLTSGPGHQSNTPLPGQAGVSVLFGRSVTYGAPFGQVTRLHPGDVITATTGQGTFHYVVDRVRRPGDPQPSQIADGEGRLILVTTEGNGWRGGWAPQRVVYVDATLRGKAQPAPDGLPTAIPSNAQAMHNDTSTLVILVLWLQALVVCGAAIAWALQRWGRWQVWLVGVPTVLAILWGASGAAMALLPNLI